MDPSESSSDEARERARAPEKATEQGPVQDVPPALPDGFAIAARAGTRLAQLEPAVDNRSPAEQARGALAPSQTSLAASVDPLEEFFYREGEPGSLLLETGMATAPKREASLSVELPREFLTFLLGSEEYGIEIGHVREILKAPPITEVPRAAAHILGLITVRGEVIAVIDPRRRLNLLPGVPSGSSRVVVCDAGEGLCGLLVDAVSEVVRLAPSSVESRAHGISGVDTDYLSGIGRDGDRLIILLDTGLLLRRPAAGMEPPP